MPYIIKTNDLTKTIGGKTLISNVNMHVKKGEIYGFLGPNGAGKTTVICGSPLPGAWSFSGRAFVKILTGSLGEWEV